VLPAELAVLLPLQPVGGLPLIFGGGVAVFLARCAFQVDDLAHGPSLFSLRKTFQPKKKPAVGGISLPPPARSEAET
jgi:hypothetical protein